MTKPKSKLKILDVLQRHFEGQFGTGIVPPVTRITKTQKVEESSSSDHYETDMDEPATVVLELDESKSNRMAPSVRESQRSFMSSKPPCLDNTRMKQDHVANEEEDLTNLKHDAALQRLLRESQLLHKDSNKNSLELCGKSRVKALEQYAISLGGKVKADKTPIRLRRRIKEKAQQRKEKAAKEAKEAGIVTAKEKTIKKRTFKKNLQLDNLHNIGHFKKGILTIRESEIRRIKGK